MPQTTAHPATGDVAVIHRMVLPDHTCPYGVKAKELLEHSGFEVEDHHLTTRTETDAFKLQHGVDTPPQIFVHGKRIGGYDELRRFVDEHGASQR